MSIQIRRAILAAVVLVAALFSTRAAQAQLLVSPDITQLGDGLYNYNYTITNNTGQDIYLIDIGTAMNPSAVQDISVPTGFESAFDPGLGLVTFLENTSTFGPTPMNGFQFDSPYAGGGSFFDGNYIDANFNNQIVSGTTIGPVNTPEPGSIAALVALAASGALLRGRRRRQES